MLEFRNYRPADRPACLDLIRTGHDPDFSGDRFRWLHEQAPGGPSRIALGLDGNTVVGIYSVIPRELVLGERTFIGGRDVDPVVHPAYRGQGVFSRLLQFGLDHFEGLDFFFNFANRSSSFGFLKNGWKNILNLDDRVCQLGYPGISSREFLVWLASYARCRGSAESTRQIEPEEAGEILRRPGFRDERQNHVDRLGVKRSAAYLKWRYLDNPLHRYLWFSAGGPSDPLQLAVCRYSAAPGRLDVLDWTSPEGGRGLDQWLPLWAEKFPGAAVTIWSAIPPDQARCFVGNPLRRGKGLNFLVRPRNGRPVPAGLLEAGSWFITRGDLEIN